MCHLVRDYFLESEKTACRQKNRGNDHSPGNRLEAAPHPKLTGEEHLILLSDLLAVKIRAKKYSMIDGELGHTLDLG
jgi:hypothetical protein